MWQAPNAGSTGHPEALWFRERLLHAHSDRIALDLQATARRDLPERQVSFSLFLQPQPQARSVPLARIDWRALTGGHSNPRKGPSEVSGTRVSATHYHAFDLNYVVEEDRMRRAVLPFAREIKTPLADFPALRGIAGELFRIDNIDLVPPPPWQGRLFER